MDLQMPEQIVLDEIANDFGDLCDLMTEAASEADAESGEAARIVSAHNDFVRQSTGVDSWLSEFENDSRYKDL